jgi:Rieske Fe-S protein
MGRRLDPGDSSGVVKCCSLSGSVFDLSGKPVGGAAKHPLKTFSIQKKGNCLEIDIASH